MDHLNGKSFLQHLNTQFTVGAPSDGSVWLELVSVTEHIDTPRQENFSLLFRGPLEPFFPQRIYHLKHESLGSLELFLVPIGPDGKGMQYEAVFNRLRQAVK